MQTNELNYAPQHVNLDGALANMERHVEREKLAQLEREDRARKEAAFVGDASIALEHADRAREVIGDLLVRPFNPHDPSDGVLLGRALERVEGAAAIDRSKLWIAGEQVLCLVHSPFDPAREIPSATVHVLLEDAIGALTAVAHQEQRLREAFGEKAAREETERQAQREREERAEIARRQRERRDEPYTVLPPAAVAALHVAAGTSAKTRSAFIELARALCAAQQPGAPSVQDAEIDALAAELARPLRAQAELKANTERADREFKEQLRANASATGMAWR